MCLDLYYFKYSLLAFVCMAITVRLLSVLWLCDEDKFPKAKVEVFVIILEDGGSGIVELCSLFPVFMINELDSVYVALVQLFTILPRLNLANYPMVKLLKVGGRTINFEKFVIMMRDLLRYKSFTVCIF